MSGGAMLGLALLALPTAVAVQQMAATPLLVLTALALVWTARARLARVLLGIARFWPVLLVAAWGLLTASWSIAPAASAAAAMRWGALALLGGTVATVAGRLDEAERRRAALGLAAGTALAAVLVLVESASAVWLTNALRLFPDPPRNIHALKPATSVLAVLLAPAVLAAARAGGRAAALAVAGLGAAAVLAVPGESARLALAAGGVAGLVAYGLPEATRRRAPSIAVLAVLAGAPMLILLALAGARAGVLPASALHRLAIWDFVLRAAGSHLAAGLPQALVGTGFETARVLPGGRERIDAAALDRLGATGPAREAILAAPDHAAELLPLHPHNGLLQVLLELGPVGVALAALVGWMVGRAIAAADTRGERAMLAACATSGLVLVLLAFGVWQAWWSASLWLAVAACRVAAVSAASLDRAASMTQNSAASGTPGP